MTYRLIHALQKMPMRPDSNMTRHALMVTGEFLMGEQGLDAPPLHVIAAEAGQSNKYAVQYHFKDRERLIQAIVAKRNEAVILRRAELALEAVAIDAIGEVEALVEAMFLPMVEQVGEKSPTSFFRLLIQWLNLPWQHDLMTVRRDVTRDPHTTKIVTFFEKALPHLTLAQISWRLRIQSRQLLTCLVEHDNLRRMDKVPSDSEAAFIADTLGMISAAMKA